LLVIVTGYFSVQTSCLEHDVGKVVD
jgi:hypothetical protein